MKVLCVDDDANARTVYQGLRKILPDDEISVVNSGEEAIDAVEKEHYDVIISDLQMHEISGIDVLRYVKKVDLTAEVIIVTGFGSVDSAVEAMRLGARDFIEKPINILLLIEKINKIRDYQLRIQEVEEYRQVKETVEEQAGRETHALEKRLQTMQSAINESIAILEQLDSKADAAAVDTLLSKLTPFKF
ncbi:MAG: response regulator [Proteobacteria bacterium]|nr:response regulator [Pseudomonadota bacterium]